MDNDLDLRDTMLVELGRLERKVLIVEPFIELGEIALNLEQQACQ